MAAIGRFFFTPHSINRYRSRVHRGISYEKALRELIEESTGAHYVKDYVSGAQYWRGPKPMRLRMLVVPAVVVGELPVCITVLPAADEMI